MSTKLADEVNVLRDEVLDTAEIEDREPPGAEVFEAVIRALVAYGDTSPGLDLTLHDAIARRLAWGDSEEVVLADAEAVFSRLLTAAQRAFRDPAKELVIIEVVGEVACAASRIVAIAAVGRAGRERSARLREELAQRRLRDALSRQHDEIARLEAALGE
jgi:hypothetical protein